MKLLVKKKPLWVSKNAENFLTSRGTEKGL